MKRPSKPGHYWFLPDPSMEVPEGLNALRIDMPIVLLVGQDKLTRDMPPPRLVVRFPGMMLYVDDMPGMWEEIKAPDAMRKVAMARMREALHGRG